MKIQSNPIQSNLPMDFKFLMKQICQTKSVRLLSNVFETKI
jgi:hypothetical protein